MRLVETDLLKAGMVVGKPVYNPSSSISMLLLAGGVALTPVYIKALKRHDIQGVYIQDEFSEEVEIQEVVTVELRNEMGIKIKSLFTSIQSESKATSKEAMKSLNSMLEDMIDQILSNRKLMVNLVDLKSFDNYTFQHSVNVAVLATVIGVAKNLNRASLHALATGALFHDIGKMQIEKEILNKPGKLTPEEFVRMKEHAELGFAYATKNFTFTYDTLQAIAGHHEKVDGSGYPNKRECKGIHRFAKIVAIADVYDAMTSKRCYHEGVLPSEAIEYIMGSAGQHFDMGLVSLFLRKVPAYPEGTHVELSNGLSGIVVENFENMNMRPRVKILTDNPKEKVYVDLTDPKNLQITVVKMIRALAIEQD